MREPVAIVVPTTGRATLGRLLDALAAQHEPPAEVVLVDDRPDGRAAAPLRVPPALADRTRVVATGGRGPAAARNAGWRSTAAGWIAFLDDDVAPPPGWTVALGLDLVYAAERTAAVQGRVRVPLPAGRRPTDHERGVAGLEQARWATADMAFRRAALEDAGGFDARFPRAYREDADLALRLLARGWTLVQGRREVAHPPGEAGPWASVRRQAGNADDALMRRLHGPGWRARAGAPRGALPRHLAVSAAGAAAVAAGLAGRRVPAAAALAGWAAGTGAFAARRIAPGPRDAREVATMLATSVAIPPAAVAHRVRGELRARRLAPIPGARPARARVAVLFDRDGTLVHDVPYNGDPALVRPVAAAPGALGRLRAAGVPSAVVTNQSGIARGLLDPAQVDAVHRRIEEVLGPLGPWLVCPHGDADACACRKPRPGLVLAAAERLGVPPQRCVVIGDTGADVAAARAAGARAVLVPNAVTRREEVRAAPVVARDLLEAVDLALGSAA